MDECSLQIDPQVTYINWNTSQLHAHANAMGHIRSKLILSNLNYFVMIQSKNIFLWLKKNSSIACSKSINVLLPQNDKNTKFVILILFKKIEEIPTIETKDTFGI
jgi:hypothetical protein